MKREEYGVRREHVATMLDEMADRRIKPSLVGFIRRRLHKLDRNELKEVERAAKKVLEVSG